MLIICLILSSSCLVSILESYCHKLFALICRLLFSFSQPAVTMLSFFLREFSSFFSQWLKYLWCLLRRNCQCLDFDIYSRRVICCLSGCWLSVWCNFVYVVLLCRLSEFTDSVQFWKSRNEMKLVEVVFLSFFLARWCCKSGHNGLMWHNFQYIELCTICITVTVYESCWCHIAFWGWSSRFNVSCMLVSRGWYNNLYTRLSKSLIGFDLMHVTG